MWHSWYGDGDLAPLHENSSVNSNNVSLTIVIALTKFSISLLEFAVLLLIPCLCFNAEVAINELVSSAWNFCSQLLFLKAPLTIFQSLTYRLSTYLIWQSWASTKYVHTNLYIYTYLYIYTHTSLCLFTCKYLLFNVSLEYKYNYIFLLVVSSAIFFLSSALYLSSIQTIFRVRDAGSNIALELN